MTDQTVTDIDPHSSPKRRVRFAARLFDRSRAARTMFVLAVWPFVWASDRWAGMNPPSRFRDGLD